MDGASGVGFAGGRSGPEPPANREDGGGPGVAPLGRQLINAAQQGTIERVGALLDQGVAMLEETESDYSHEDEEGGEEGVQEEEDDEDTHDEDDEEEAEDGIIEEEEVKDRAGAGAVAGMGTGVDNDGNDLTANKAVSVASSHLSEPSQKHAIKRGRPGNAQYDSEEDLRTNLLGHANLALRRFFMTRMTENIVALGGDAAVLLKGWQVQVTMRTSMGAGILDVVYHGIGGRSYTSVISVLIAMGLSSSSRNLRCMTQLQHFHTATECKERYFLSQMLGWSGFRADDVYIADGMLQIMVRGLDEADATADDNRIKWAGTRTYCLSPRPSQRKIYKSQDPERLLAFGNTTVLDWGRVITEPLFHTAHHIFPLGLRVLRIEHDVIKDELVDCLCEIASTPDTSPPPPTMSEQDAAARILPLFRITVAWKHRLPGAEGFMLANRVYEARTPHDAWSAAFAERVLTEPFDSAKGAGAQAMDIDGLGERGEASSASASSSSSSSSSSPSLSSSYGSAPGAEVSSDPHASPFAYNPPLGAYMQPSHGGLGPDSSAALSIEPQDEEEQLLRNQVRCLREEHLAAAHAVEATGLRKAAQPRLRDIDTDSFIDSGLLRLLEGVNALVVNLEDYIFLDAREADANRRQSRRSLTEMHSKCSHLAKVAARDRKEMSMGSASRASLPSSAGAEAKPKAKRLRLVMKANPLLEQGQGQGQGLEEGQPGKPTKRRKQAQSERPPNTPNEANLPLKKRGRNQHTGPAPKILLPVMMAPESAPQPPAEADALDLFSQANFKSKMSLPPNISDKQAEYLRELERQARMVRPTFRFPLLLFGPF